MKPKRIVKYCVDTASRQITHKEVIGKENIRKMIYDAVHQWFVS